jgi:hypothetical protein
MYSRLQRFWFFFIKLKVRIQWWMQNWILSHNYNIRLYIFWAVSRASIFKVCNFKFVTTFQMLLLVCRWWRMVLASGTDGKPLQFPRTRRVQAETLFFNLEPRNRFHNPIPSRFLVPKIPAQVTCWVHEKRRAYQSSRYCTKCINCTLRIILKWEQSGSF